MTAPPPGDELKALIALEKAAAEPAPADARERLAHRLAAQLDADVDARRESGTTTSSSVARTARGLSRLGGALLFGAGVVTGAAIRTVWPAPPPPVPVPHVEHVVVEKPVERAPDEPWAPVVPESPSPSAPPSQTTPSLAHVTKPASSAAPAPAPSDEDLVRERQMIERARSALARRDPTAALSAIDQHEKDFPRGQFVEMREALAVQALVSAGRGDDARSRGQRFHRLFPGSMYNPVVDNALSSIP